MSGTTAAPDNPIRRPGQVGRLGWLGWLGAGLLAAARGLALGALAVAGLAALLAVPLGPRGGRGLRRVAERTRRLAGSWCGVPIPSPAVPTESAGRRELAWTALDAGVGWLLVTAPAGLMLYGLAVLAAQLPDPQGTPVPPTPVDLGRYTAWLGSALSHGGLSPWAAVPLGLASVALGLWSGPYLLPVHGRFAHTFLGPTREVELSQRVGQLTRSRADSIDTGAAELRRIERDLHDGAQARLVALGMALDTAGHLLDSSPEATRALLSEARDSSVKALAELRDLVRGIHPPVLADRGLADAVRALALDLPLRVHVSGDLPARPPAPVESAAYFTVSELLANVTKHADADQVWLDISHQDGMLRISVTDDGRGGADPAAGTGLRGIERRLAAFDGVLAVSSPPGGPTMAGMEIPCALS